MSGINAACPLFPIREYSQEILPCLGIKQSKWHIAEAVEAGERLSFFSTIRGLVRLGQVPSVTSCRPADENLYILATKAVRLQRPASMQKGASLNSGLDRSIVSVVMPRRDQLTNAFNNSATAAFCASVNTSS
eukprot:g79654.t1